MDATYRSTAAARPDHRIIEDAARNVIDAGLRNGDSAFTRGREIWTSAAAAELHHAFVERPIAGRGAFLQKLQIQLSGASPEAVQLAAELLYVNMLPLNDLRGRTKRDRLYTVLGWLPDRPAIPPFLDLVLDHGVLNGGVGFKVQAWSQLAFLVRFVRHWCTLPVGERAFALSEPWQFRETVDAVTPSIPSQRGVLLYLAFPDTFEAIAAAQHKTQIRRAFAELLDRPPGDVDADLQVIRRRLQERSSAPVHFYFSPWRERWMAPKDRVRRAWLVRPRDDTLLASWVADGFVATYVPHDEDLAAGLTLGEVERAIGLSHPELDYVRRSQAAHDAHALQSRMKSGDIVVAGSGDPLRIGQIVGPAFHDPPWIFRPVDWNETEPIDVSLLPEALQAHLASAGHVVDLTEDVAILESVLAGFAVGTDDQEPAGDDVALLDPTVIDAAVDGPPVLRKPDDVLAAGLHMPIEVLTEIVELIEDRRQVILAGPPGTGKTYLARELVTYLTEGAPERMTLVQFHPSTTYEDFFEGYRPVDTGTDGQLRFQLRPGPFSQLVARARADLARPYFMIVDEINRANLAKVFGELYYLLEYRDRPVNLLYRPEQPFTLPENVYLIGTMNTVDRSVVNVDAAMRRRFAFFELHPDRPPVAGLLERWVEATGRDAERVALLSALNRRIDAYDLKVGPAYLMKADADREDGLARVWRYSILPLLVEQQHGRLAPDEVEELYGLAAIRALAAGDEAAEA
jgi:5-methylcytosine-specific restriction protein B